MAPTPFSLSLSPAIHTSPSAHLARAAKLRFHAAPQQGLICYSPPLLYLLLHKVAAAAAAAAAAVVGLCAHVLCMCILHLSVCAHVRMCV